MSAGNKNAIGSSEAKNGCCAACNGENLSAEKEKDCYWQWKGINVQKIPRKSSFEGAYHSKSDLPGLYLKRPDRKSRNK